MRRVLVLGACLTLALSMSACGQQTMNDSESAATSTPKNVEPSAASSAPDSATAEASEAVKSEEPTQTYRDTIDTKTGGLGAALLHDELTELAAATSPQKFELLFHRSGDTGGDINLLGDQVQLSLPYTDAAGRETYFSILADDKVLDYANAGQWLQLRGVFTAAISPDNERQFEITLVDELAANKARDEQRCQQTSTIEAEVFAAAEELQEADAVKYAELRDEWEQSPQVWWAVKSTSQTMAQSAGQVGGDALAQVCGDYWF